MSEEEPLRVAEEMKISRKRSPAPRPLGIRPQLAGTVVSADSSTSVMLIVTAMVSDPPLLSSALTVTEYSDFVS